MLVCAIALGALGVVQARAGEPVGAYLDVDPTDTMGAPLLATGSAISPLFGPVVCVSTCKGGIGGVFISEPWSDFQTISATARSGVTTLVIDSYGNLNTVMSNIGTIESSMGFTFELTLGLKAGDNAAYNVLDMYAAVGGGNFGGSEPNLTTMNMVVPDFVEGKCKFSSYMNGSPSGNGGTFATNSFPEQCTLRTDSSGKITCIAQPRMWGTDTNSPTANATYQKAYVQALQDYVDFVNGISGYHGPVPHAVQALKLSGIANHDEEIAISGNPGQAMPPYNCGYTGATDAEQIWTDQSMPGPPPFSAYESNIMESTWLSLVTSSMSIMHTGATPLSFIIDVVGDNEFPPVQPAHCPVQGEQCAYTCASDSQIPHLTTGEMEYLIEQALSNGLAADNVTIQTQGLQANTPDNNVAIDAGYQSKEIPCSMNALVKTGIGYQSGGMTIVTGADKTAYLASITNGPAYGAQYIELSPEQLQAFISDLNGISFGGMSNYGTSATQNIDMLSRTIEAAEATMATNASNSANGSLCPLPESISGTGSTTILNWIYP